LRVTSTGAFSGRWTARELDDPFVASEEFWLSGRFIRGGRAARLTVRTRAVGEGGTVCDSGNRRATANRVRRPAARRPALTG
jgi:hypothetical protein